MTQNSTADTQDDIIRDAIVVFVPGNKHSSPFVISGSTYDVNDKNNTYLNDHCKFSVPELENINVNWKMSGLNLFGLVWYGLVWSDLIYSSLVWSDLV